MIRSSVNALLTQIDRLKKHPNVLVLTTSNLTSAIDLAFVDRADIKQYIGLPNTHARYEIIRSCLQELIRVGIIVSPTSNSHSSSSIMSLFVSPFSKTVSVIEPLKEPLLEYRSFLQAGSSASSTSNSLYGIAEITEGLSGRALRKLPFQAHAYFLQSSCLVSLEDYLQALESAVVAEKSARSDLTREEKISSSPGSSPSSIQPTQNSSNTVSNSNVLVLKAASTGTIKGRSVPHSSLQDELPFNSLTFTSPPRSDDNKSTGAYGPPSTSRNRLKRSPSRGVGVLEKTASIETDIDKALHSS